MMLGIQMISVAEAMGARPRSSGSTTRSSSTSARKPRASAGRSRHTAGAGPGAGLARQPRLPARFTAAMMLKDLKLAQAAAQSVGAATPLGAEAYQLYALFARQENEGLDFSGIIKMMRGTSG
jgi:3-hydroxyisobutyrate dehydrogenase